MSNFLSKNCMVSFKNSVIYSLPFILWFYSFKSFYANQLKLIVDSQISFIYTNYYLNSILRGVYPMWNPYNIWGRPDDFSVRMIGEFNPFLYLIAILNQLGMSYSTAYFAYLVSYFFLGMIGFYLLAKRLFKKTYLAYLALILLMFTNVGSHLFNDFLIILILIPSIWFFYFLVAFSQTQHKTFFIGLTFASMIIVTTYLPFHFLTVFMVFILLYSIFYFNHLKFLISQYAQFIKSHKILSVVCTLSFLFSLLPGLMWAQAAGSGDYFFAWRSATPIGTNPLELDLHAINLSGFIGPHPLTRLFSNLNNIDLSYFFVPIFVFIIMLLCLIVSINRKLILTLSFSLIIFLISLADVTPVHMFLFEHIFFFKYFRNLHWLVWFCVPIFILFLVEQFNLLINLKPKNRLQAWGIIIYVVLIHIGFSAFLVMQENVIMTSFIALGISSIFFILYFLKILKLSHSAFLMFLLLAVAIQPLEVFHNISRNWHSYSFKFAQHPFTVKESIPIFSFIRPEAEKPYLKGGALGTGEIRDTSGFVEWDRLDYGLREAHALQENITHDVLKEYVQYKFILYDQVQEMDQDNVDWAKVEQNFMRRDNLAFISDHHLEINNLPSMVLNRNAEVVTENSHQFQIIKFDTNYIKFKTHFLKDKFLVYNDSYHDDWQATINGKPADVVRANIAFKGLKLPAGENVVYLRFRPLWRHFIIVVLFGLFGVMFIYLTYAFYQFCCRKKYTVERINPHE